LLGNAHYTTLMIFIGIHTMIVVGLCLLMGYTGQVSLGQAGFYGIGAFISAILSTRYGVSPWLALLAAAVVTGAVAYIIGRPIFRLQGPYLAMATLGFGMILYIIFERMTGVTGGPTGIPNIPYLSIFGFDLDTDFKYYYLVWLVCIFILLISRNIVNSRVGRALRAINGSEPAAQSLGINVAQFKVKVFVLSAVYASVAGSLYVHYLTYVSPQPFNFMFSVKLVVMVVIGGMASIWGALFGTAVITLLSDYLQPLGDYDVMVFGLILILVMVFMPQGLTRGLRALYYRIRPRRTESYELKEAAE
jgi:branched-chain amino acid transport system permease protein